MQIVCTRDGGLDLGGGVVLSKGPNEVADVFWSEWLAKYIGSQLVDDRVVYAVEAAPEPEPVAETETVTEETPHE